MDIKSRLNALASKKMDRTDFLRHVAIGAVAVVGGGVLLRLTSLKPGVVDSGSRSGMAYGDMAYGGSRPRSGGRF